VGRARTPPPHCASLRRCCAATHGSALLQLRARPVFKPVIRSRRARPRACSKSRSCVAMVQHAPAWDVDRDKPARNTQALGPLQASAIYARAVSCGA
jgi:hypothetical protein